VNRRDLLAGLLAAGALSCAQAQPRSTLRTVGLLSAFPPPSDEEFSKLQSVSQFRRLGWIDGENFRIERAYSGHEGRLAQFAKALVEKRVDVIWALGPEAALAAAEATKTVPIVFWGVGYPVEQGLVDSLARPGRNVTGVTVFDGIGVYQKQLELLREIVPGLTRVAWIRTPSAIRTLGAENLDLHAPIVAAARTLDVVLQQIELHRDEDIDRAFAEITQRRPEAMWVFGTMMTLRHRARIVEFAARERIPAIYFDRSWVELGGLVSYGAHGLSGISRSIEYVDRILRGAKSSELPVEMPSRYELAVNLKTARQLSLNISQTLIARADRVIE
jgi:putative ABC transport system substrate-binding protein